MTPGRMTPQRPGVAMSNTPPPPFTGTTTSTGKTKGSKEGKGSGTPKRQENWQKSLKGSTPAKGGNAAERRNAASSGSNAGGSGSSSGGGGGGGSGGGSGNGGSGSGNAMANGMSAMGPDKKKRKLSDKILPQKVRDLVPESQAYMDLLAFERKLDATIMRKRLDIQEALKRPQKIKRKLRIFISHTFFPAKPEAADGDEESAVASWELRVEGRLLDDAKPSDATPGSAAAAAAAAAASKIPKRKFSSFFKSLVIELDKELYGPDNHLVEWHRTNTTQETDGFQVKRPGDQNVQCTLLLLLDYQPMQFKLDSRLARLLGIHTATRPTIISALWNYIKDHKLQDPHEREFINCDRYLTQIFDCFKMKFADIPQRLHPLLHPPDPIVINHLISVDGPDYRKTACYDIDVEVDDSLKTQMNNFLLSTTSQQEISTLDTKIHETVETINQLKSQREFMLEFSKDPQEFLQRWIVSQARDLKSMADVVGNPEEERRADFFFQDWSQEAVCRYFYAKVQQKRAELEQALNSSSRT